MEGGACEGRPPDTKLVQHKEMNCGEVTDMRQWDLLRLLDIRPPREERRARYGEPAFRGAQMRECRRCTTLFPGIVRAPCVTRSHSNSP